MTKAKTSDEVLNNLVISTAKNVSAGMMSGLTRMAKSAPFLFGIAACFAACMAFLPLGGCTTIARRVSVERRPLTFVGQVTFGTPEVRDRRVVVPLSFTGGEWGLHSAIATYRVESRVSKHTIEMTVLTSLAGRKPVATELHLGQVAPGQYSVAYRDPDGTRHPLGEIEIGKTQ